MPPTLQQRISLELGLPETTGYLLFTFANERLVLPPPLEGVVLKHVKGSVFVGSFPLAHPPPPPHPHPPALALRRRYVRRRRLNEDILNDVPDEADEEEDDAETEEDGDDIDDDDGEDKDEIANNKLDIPQIKLRRSVNVMDTEEIHATLLKQLKAFRLTRVGLVEKPSLEVYPLPGDGPSNTRFASLDPGQNITPELVENIITKAITEYVTVETRLYVGLVGCFLMKHDKKLHDAYINRINMGANAVTRNEVDARLCSEFRMLWRFQDSKIAVELPSVLRTTNYERIRRVILSMDAATQRIFTTGIL